MAHGATQPGGTPYLEFRGICKTFPGIRALDDVSFGVREGSLHALLGENGAGKSTLLKTLSGAYQPDGGSLILGGAPAVFHSTADAIRNGVAVIYQELHLVPELSIAENLFLGHLPQRWGVVQRRRLEEETRAQLEVLGEDLDPRMKVGRLPIAQRQMVEIAKALSRDAKVIAFDEPTSSLSHREVDRLFGIIEQLKAAGNVVLYVSHRMEEILRICDAATVLRDGRHIETFASLEGVSQDTLVARMVGRAIDDVFHYSPRPAGEVMLEVTDVTGEGLTAPANFSARGGEILGFFGLVGAGRTELLKLIYGAVRPRSGRLRIAGQPVTVRKPADAIRAGMVLCPEDRKKEGIIPVRSVLENVNLSGRRHFSPLHFLIHERRERENADRYVARLAIKTPTLSQLIMNLSGGNQQKAILARWLSEDLKVLLLDEPTRGIDVGAKSEIYSIIYDLARQGVAVIMVSSELPEVLGVADRVAVMRQGRIVTTVARGEAIPEELLKWALPVAETGTREIA